MLSASKQQVSTLDLLYYDGTQQQQHCFLYIHSINRKNRSAVLNWVKIVRDIVTDGGHFYIRLNQWEGEADIQEGI